MTASPWDKSRDILFWNKSTSEQAFYSCNKQFFLFVCLFVCFFPPRTHRLKTKAHLHAEHLLQKQTKQPWHKQTRSTTQLTEHTDVHTTYLRDLCFSSSLSRRLLSVSRSLSSDLDLRLSLSRFLSLSPLSLSLSRSRSRSRSLSRSRSWLRYLASL